MSFCSGCNGEDEASICKWCHQDKVNRARKQGALEEQKKQRIIIKNKIIELNKSIKLSEKENQWCFENPESAEMDSISGQARVENNELNILKCKAKIEVLKELEK